MSFGICPPPQTLADLYVERKKHSEGIEESEQIRGKRWSEMGIYDGKEKWA